MAELSKRTVVAVIGGSLFLWAVLGPFWFFSMVMLVLCLIGIWESIRLKAWLYTVLVIAGFAAAAALKLEDGKLVLALTLSTWATDIFAYLVGSKFGKRKLAPTISPKKTWEGAIGGCFGGAITGLLFGLPWIGLIAGTFGQAGDLLESYYKRRAGAKDSGSIFPGHGGILDRFDSFIVNAALSLVLMKLVKSYF